MRHWSPASRPAPAATGALLADLIGGLGQPGFGAVLLDRLRVVVPAASCSVYQTGPDCAPRLYLSASHGVPDTTRLCWSAYLSGPHRGDRSLAQDAAGSTTPLLCHVDARDVPHEHRARVYEAHGMQERVSVVQRRAQGGLLALNLYRHTHQRPFTDAQIADFEALAPALWALAHKHVALAPDGAAVGDAATPQPDPPGVQHWLARLAGLDAALTPREREVCARVLLGMTHEGIAADLACACPR